MRSTIKRGKTAFGGTLKKSLTVLAVLATTIVVMTTSSCAYIEGYVYVDGHVLVGADGHRITLRNNPDAENPSWNELKAFVAEDRTDEHPYRYLSFICYDFAEMLHNNAEEAGMRSAYVMVRLGPSVYYPTGVNHALNAFETTDRGLVYIDSTRPPYYRFRNADTVLEVEVGKQYVRWRRFPGTGGWNYPMRATPQELALLSLGVVEEIETIQW